MTASVKPSPQVIANGLLESARQNLQRDGELHNVFLCQRDNDLIAMALSSLPRELWPTVGKHFQSEPFNWVAHISEAWGKVVDEKSDLSRPPSEYEDKSECIVLSLRMGSGEYLSCVQEFNRDNDGQPIFDQAPVWDSNSHSRVLG